ncbi:MAG: APC family permease [Gammaproteobacteria bacterium]|nr:APC family permease [Gammaproteobacteria bacterium]
MMRYKMGLFSLVGAGLGSMIGSGWLFSAYYISKGMRGSGAYAVWLVGGAIILLLALSIAEIITLHPKRGAFTRLLTLAYNHDLGYITAVANWFGMVVVIPTEAEGTVQYLSTIKPNWADSLFVHGQLTYLGLLIVALLVIFYAVLNFWGARVLAKSNNILSIFKVIIPIAISVIIIATSFHHSNFTVRPTHTLLPFHLEHTFSMVMSGGIILAFNGFQCIASFCAEAKDPTRNVPRALVISILGALAIYLLLQTAFIGGLPPQMLKAGWSALNFNSPIAQLTTLIGLHMVALILYIDACVSPSGTAIIYVGTTGRMLTAMAQEKQAPSFFNVLHPKYHFSRRSLVFNIVLALSLLLLFRSWQTLMILVSEFHIISYMACPLALMRLRIKEHYAERRYRLPCAMLISPVLFVVFTILYCSTTEVHLVLTSSVSTVFYLIYISVHNRWRWPCVWYSFKRSYLFAIYLIWLTLLGLLNIHSKQDTLNTLHGIFYALVVASSLCFYYHMVYKYRQPKDRPAEFNH